MNDEEMLSTYLPNPEIVQGELGFMKNDRLRKAGVHFAYTQEHVEEYARCSDPDTGLEYFTKKYMKVEVPDGQILKYDPFPYQIRFAKAALRNRFILVKLGRQMGKCLYIDTKLVIRSRVDGKVSEVTAGQFFELVRSKQGSSSGKKENSTGEEIQGSRGGDGLRQVRDLRVSLDGADEPRHSRAQALRQRLRAGASALGAEVAGRNASQASREQSLEGPRGEVLSVLGEIRRKDVRRGGRQEVGVYEEEARVFEHGLEKVPGGGRWGRGAGEGDPVRAPEDVLAGEAGREARRGGGPSTLGGSPGEVAEELQEDQLFKSFPGTVQCDHEEVSILGRLLCDVGSSGHDDLHEQGTSHQNVIWKDVASGFCGRKEDANHRIRRGLLAFIGDGESDAREGSRRSVDQRRIRCVSSEGIRLQEGSREDDRGLPELSDIVERKFVESHATADFDVWSDSGWVPVTHAHLTVDYDEWVLVTESHRLTCADDHIVFGADGSQVFVKDLRSGDEVLTENGPETVLSCRPNGKSSRMYDFTVDHPSHRFYADGVLSHNTTAATAIILWHVLFKRRYKVALTANKLEQAIEILDRIKLAIEWIPPWLQQGMITWRATRLAFENGSMIQAAATSMSGIRGKSYSMIYMDEFAHIHPNTQKKFYESVFPAISAGKRTKLFITTTPNGLDMFYKLWVDSENKTNDFKRVEAHWSEMPGRDEEWARKERERLGEEGFAQEYDTEFLGSSATLINGRKLANIPYNNPLSTTTLGVKVFKEPQKDHNYVCTVDVSRGLGLDYQAMTVVDVTSKPWEVVASYRNNKLPPYLLHEVVVDVAKHYNHAMVLVETNDVGLRVAEDLLQIDEYENVIMTQVKGKYGSRVGGGFGTQSRYGVKTTPQVKKIGCANLKQLVERDQLILNDRDILWELGRFVGKNNTYKAEEGAHDDLVMCLVLFGWLSDQPYFKDSVDTTGLRKALIDQANDAWGEHDITPFGVVDDARDEVQEGPVDPTDPFSGYFGR